MSSEDKIGRSASSEEFKTRSERGIGRSLKKADKKSALPNQSREPLIAVLNAPGVDALPLIYWV